MNSASPNWRARRASRRSPPATRSARCCAWCRAATRPWWTPISRRSCAATSTRWPPNCTARGSISCSRTAASPRRAAFQGKDAILSGPAGGIVGAARTAGDGRARPDHRLRHGRHLDRRRALRRRVRAGLRDRGGRRAHARADDGDQHGGGRRRLDPAFRRRAHARRPRFRRRRSRARLLPPRRPADRDRRQCLRRQDPARAFPGDLRPGRRPAARRRRSCGRNSPPWPTRSPRATGEARTPRAGRRGLPAHRRRQHGQRDQAGLGAEGPRRHPLRAAMLRRRRRPARLPGRRRARHGDGVHPPLRRRAVGLRHGARRPDRDARAGGRECRSTPDAMPELDALADRLAADARRRAAGPGRRPGRDRHTRARCICATPAPRPR